MLYELATGYSKILQLITEPELNSITIQGNCELTVSMANWLAGWLKMLKMPTFYNTKYSELTDYWALILADV